MTGPALAIGKAMLPLATVTIAVIALIVTLSACGPAALPAAPASHTPIPLAGTPTPLPSPSPPSTFTAAPLSPTARPTTLPPLAAPTPAALTLEEYRVAAAGEPLSVEFRKQLGEAVMSKRAKWRRDDFAGHLDGLNEQLAPFGYKFVTAAGNWPDRANLRRGSEVLIANTNPPYRLEVSDSRLDFAMLMENAPNVRPFNVLVRKAGLQPWDPAEHAFLNKVTFVGDDLLTLDAKPQGNDPIQYQVKRADKVVYTGTAPPMGVDILIKGLWSWDGHWALEVAEQVVLDGVSIGPGLGYDKVYGYRVVDRQPFYFFERGGKVGLSYAGKTLPQSYEEVMHYKCCLASMFNPQGNDDMVWFWGRRDGAWWYVEAGVYR